MSTQTALEEEGGMGSPSCLASRLTASLLVRCTFFHVLTFTMWQGLSSQVLRGESWWDVPKHLTRKTGKRQVTLSSLGSLNVSSSLPPLQTLQLQGFASHTHRWGQGRSLRHGSLRNYFLGQLLSPIFLRWHSAKAGVQYSWDNLLGDPLLTEFLTGTNYRKRVNFLPSDH